jgi:hypothetical protein
MDQARRHALRDHPAGARTSAAACLPAHVHQTTIDRVQNLNTSQPLLERVAQVGTVDVDTAGSDDSEVRFVGVADPAEIVMGVDRVGWAVGW